MLQNLVLQKEKQVVSMNYNDLEQQKQQNPYSLYTPHGPVPVAHSGQAVPVTDKVPGIAVPTSPQPGIPGGPAWPQHAFIPQSDTMAPTVAQHALTPQPGMPGPTWPQPISPRRSRRSRSRSAAIFALTCLLAVIFGVGLLAGWAFAHSSKAVNGAPANASTSSSSVGSNSSTVQTAQETAIARVEPSVVEIQGTTVQGTSLGSGIIVDTKGDIVTNNHVVDGTSSLKVVLSNGSQETAQLVGTNPANDLAVINIQPFANMAVATFGDSSQLTVGQDVLAIGNPLGYSGSATAGVVSALNRSMQESSQGPNLTGLIQTSVAINPGNSGGALINLQGQVVGIPTLSAINPETRTPANGIGFAIPANQVQAAVAKIVGK